MARFSDEQLRRYSRQILLREVGGHGQQRLLAARPVLLGVGEVGHTAAEYLRRAGVTELRSVTAAPDAHKHIAAQAPGFTLLWLEADLLWACCRGQWGVVGAGEAALPAAVAQAAQQAAEVSGSGAMIVGSALALVTLERLLGIGPLGGHSAAMVPTVWQIDLDSATLRCSSPG